jgi:hypothetical protein
MLPVSPLIHFPAASRSNIISQSGILSTVTEFELVSTFAPAGSRPEAIRELTEGLEKGEQLQTLPGVTGSGKTYTMASVIASPSAKSPPRDNQLQKQVGGIASLQNEWASLFQTASDFPHFASFVSAQR